MDPQTNNKLMVLERAEELYTYKYNLKRYIYNIGAKTVQTEVQLFILKIDHVSMTSATLCIIFDILICIYVPEDEEVGLDVVVQPS